MAEQSRKEDEGDQQENMDIGTGHFLGEHGLRMHRLEESGVLPEASGFFRGGELALTDRVAIIRSYAESLRGKGYGDIALKMEKEVEEIEEKKILWRAASGSSLGERKVILGARTAIFNERTESLEKEVEELIEEDSEKPLADELARLEKALEYWKDFSGKF
ncbi:MAG: hypothetical protein V1905_01270 [bacterium]